MADCGTFTISIDVELAWGACDRELRPRDYAAIGREREVVRRLLALFQAYDVRATWAIVGHLLLTQAAWDDGQAHPDFPRPVTCDEARDWFFQLPDSPDDPAWYGRDLVDTLRNARPAQEIGSHSFCHLAYDESQTCRAAVAADVTTARRLHADAGLPFEVFIFPRNQVGYKGLLAAAGIRVYRGHTPRWHDSLQPRALRRMANLLAFVLSLPPQPVRATVDEAGMVNVPDSMLFLGRDGLRRFVPMRNVSRMAMAGLDRAAQDGSIFHLWFHPSNFAHQTDRQIASLEDILRYAQQLRRRGKLEILAMGDIQRQLQATD